MLQLALTALALTAGPTPISRADADVAISTLMVRHDPLLHWARQLLPPDRARAASALYAWCRRLDEIVDAPGADPSATTYALDDWQARLDELWSGSPRDAFDGALLETLRAHPTLGREPFEAMLAGMRDDAASGARRYQSFRPELLEYAYCVAGTVGEMLIPVLGLDGEAAENGESGEGGEGGEEMAEAAIALGCAVQLLNIARDVRTDLLERDRIYLPREDALRCGLTAPELEGAIRDGAFDARFRRLVRLQSRRATALLRRAARALPRMRRGQALLVAVLIELHHALNDELQARDFDSISLGDDRVRVPTARKVLLTVTTAASVLLRGPAAHYAASEAARQR